MSFEGRHVVVTGGTGALGVAVVARLLEQGAVCHVPNLDGGEMTRFPHRDHERVRLRGGIDLTSEDAVDGFYDDVAELWASVHLAGGFAMAPIAEAGSAAFVDQMNMNALTCYLCCRAAARRIRAASADGGRIVNVAARPALEPRLGAGMVAYTAAKSAVAAITASLAEELANDGIWVNAVAPSILDTPANRAAMPDADHARWPGVDDVARTIVFLASPDNLATRGGVIPVTGRS
jgi:NAD(P)-dependent dehydrogenase (short-subunit alcohol dehydrogenase family)